MALEFVTLQHSVSMWHQVLPHQRFPQHVPIYISQHHHITYAAAITEPLQSLLFSPAIFSLSCAVRLQPSTSAAYCLSNWHPIFSTFFPCLLLFHFLVLPIRYILSHTYPLHGYKFCLPRFLLSMWAKWGLSNMKLIHDVLVLCFLHSSYLSLMSYNNISQRWPQIIWRWKKFSLCFPTKNENLIMITWIQFILFIYKTN